MKITIQTNIVAYNDRKCGQIKKIKEGRTALDVKTKAYALYRSNKMDVFEAFVCLPYVID